MKFEKMKKPELIKELEKYNDMINSLVETAANKEKRNDISKTSMRAEAKQYYDQYSRADEENQNLHLEVNTLKNTIIGLSIKFTE